MTLFSTLGDILQPENSNPYIDMVKDYKNNGSKKARLTRLLGDKEKELIDAERFKGNGAVLYFCNPIDEVISDLIRDINLIKKAHEKLC